MLSSQRLFVSQMMLFRIERGRTRASGEGLAKSFLCHFSLMQGFFNDTATTEIYTLPTMLTIIQ